MLASQHPYIAREGWVFILFAIVCAGVIHFSYGINWAVPLWVLSGFLIFLFRDPERIIPPVPLAIVSPVDGRVNGLKKAYDPFLDRDAFAIDVHMSKLGTYALRSPTEGKIVKKWIMSADDIRQKLASINLNADDDYEAGMYYTMWIQTDENDDVTFVMSVNRFGLKPRSYVHAGQRIGQGKRCGFARFGVRVRVYVPLTSRIEIAEHDKIIAGSNIIATLIH